MSTRLFVRRSATLAKLGHDAAHLFQLLLAAHERFVYNGGRNEATWVGAAGNGARASAGSVEINDANNALL